MPIIKFHVGTPKEHFIWVRPSKELSLHQVVTKIDVKYTGAGHRFTFLNGKMVFERHDSA